MRLRRLPLAPVLAGSLVCLALVAGVGLMVGASTRATAKPASENTAGKPRSPSSTPEKPPTRNEEAPT